MRHDGNLHTNHHAGNIPHKGFLPAGYVERSDIRLG